MSMSQARVLVIDDEKLMQKLLRVCLEDYDVLGVLSAADARKKLAGIKPDVVLLDLNLPDENGYDLLKSIRAESRVPVIILSVMGSEQEKIRCLDAGADDYVTKPFSPGELLARIRAVVRRRLPGDGETFRSGPLEIDFARRAVSVRGVRVKLTRIEYNILQLLATHAGKVVTQTQIMREIWDPGMESETNLLRVHIAYLRKKIERQFDSPELLITEPAVGYRLLVLPPG